ncbi:MAG: radical SAM protein [Deltaproteobacteria bacterium]|nr:radical SAM protein [Candidatus Zymogenaceae bacterium]
MGADKTPSYPLIHAYLYLSGGCNLRCAHCWISPSFTPKPEAVQDRLTTGDVKRIADAAQPLGLSYVKLTGGEPFLNEDIFDIIQLLAGRNLSISIETNGTLVDRDAAAFLKKNGVYSVSVSMDSHRASFHDAFRGVAGALDGVIAGTESLVAEGLDVQVIMSLVNENAADIEGLVGTAARLGAHSVKINPVNPIGRGGALMDRGKILPVEELVALSGWVETELPRRYGIETFFTIPSALKPISHLFDGRNAQCHILNIIGILAGGDISICGIGREEPELVMGNIRTDDLARVWEDSPVLKHLRDVVPRRMEGICGRCVMAGICLGSCRADAYVLSGSLTASHWMCEEAHEKGLFPQTRIIER